MDGAVITCVATADLDEVRGALPPAFRAGDPVAAGLPVASRAGFLALKRALADLAARTCPGARVEAGDFGLDHGPSGAPLVAALPPALDWDVTRLKVSVTHTRDRAWAVACLQGAGR